MNITRDTYSELNMESFTYRMIRDYVRYEADKQDPKYIVEHVLWLIEQGEKSYERKH